MSFTGATGSNGARPRRCATRGRHARGCREGRGRHCVLGRVRPRFGAFCMAAVRVRRWQSTALPRSQVPVNVFGPVGPESTRAPAAGAKSRTPSAAAWHPMQAPRFAAPVVVLIMAWPHAVPGRRVPREWGRGGAEAGERGAPMIEAEPRRGAAWMRAGLEWQGRGDGPPISAHPAHRRTPHTIACGGAHVTHGADRPYAPREPPFYVAEEFAR